MSKIATLPTELLLKILESAEPQSAFQLCRGNKLLYEVWTSHEDSILQTILRRQIIAYDQALLYARIDRKHFLGRREEVKLRDLVVAMQQNAEMCTRVIEWYEEEHNWIQNSLGTPERHQEIYDVELNAWCYYTARLIACAHDFPELRKYVRRLIKGLADRELRFLDLFVLRWVDQMQDDELRRWHDMDMPGEDRWDHPDGDPVNERWKFVVDTVDLYVMIDHRPNVVIGEEGLWSRANTDYYRPEWR